MNAVFNTVDSEDLFTPRFILVPAYFSTDPQDDPDTFADIDAVIEFFVATGRVKVIP